MRSHFARAAMVIGLAACLAGCSTASKNTTSKSSWLPSFSKKNKESSSTSSLANAPAAPNFGSTMAGASTTPSQPGYPSTAGYYGGTQYPVTPYPPVASAPPSGAYVANSQPPASSGYMPPQNPYAAPQGGSYNAAAPANPYAAAQPASAAAPGAANPYAQNAYAPPAAHDSGYNTGGPYSTTPYPGGPSGGAETPYAYSR